MKTVYLRFTEIERYLSKGISVYFITHNNADNIKTKSVVYKIEKAYTETVNVLGNMKKTYSYDKECVDYIEVGKTKIKTKRYNEISPYIFHVDMNNDLDLFSAKDFFDNKLEIGDCVFTLINHNPIFGQITNLNTSYVTIRVYKQLMLAKRKEIVTAVEKVIKISKEESVHYKLKF